MYINYVKKAPMATSKGKPIATAARLEDVVNILLYEEGVFSSTVCCKASPRSLNFNPSTEVVDITTGPVPSIGTMLSGTGRAAEDLYNKYELKE